MDDLKDNFDNFLSSNYQNPVSNSLNYNEIVMPAYRKEIIKDNYVRGLNPQIESFAGLEWGQKG